MYNIKSNSPFVKKGSSAFSELNEHVLNSLNLHLL